MNHRIELEAQLSAVEGAVARLSVFALLNLGVVDSLANGRIGVAEALRSFYHADNCLYVKHNLASKASRVMAHGVQLPDLFDALPPGDAQREFLHELSVMRGLCLGLIEEGRLVA